MNLDWIIPYEQREQAKREAWVIVRSDAPLPSRANALLRIIEMHYHRALEHLTPAQHRKVVGRKPAGYILELDTYTQHWLGAASKKELTDGVIDYIKENFHYQPLKHPNLPEGHTSYVFE